MQATQRHKRILTILLSAVLLTGFSGCSKDAGNNNKNLFQKEQSQDGSESNDSSIDVSQSNGIVDQLDMLDTTGEVYSQTILIYMVGSDLESEYGNASLDLEEMQEALPDPGDHNILVYAGGASEWQTAGLSAEEDSILQLTENGFQTISTNDVQNMGEAETLSNFIQYGMSNCDTDKYSLILWNHGAGPVFGFGLDENYSDLLSLTEMQEALEDSVGASGKKLEMIGFDACLMSSLEVADVFSDYANYLVSSQETEPGWGWNYAFLSELAEPDMDGAHMGKSIIDAYMDFGEAVFAEYPKYYSDLTLSCVDLTQYADTETALNTYFEGLGKNLDSTTFPKTVRCRDNTKDFGTYSSSFDYGMVDAVDLLHQLSDISNDISTDDASAALQKMIVYMRTNVANANGISICYPNQSDEDYADYYTEIQKSVNFVSGYTDYLQTCSDFENGAPIATHDWSIAGAIADVKPIESSESKQGGSDISLALTEEQQQNFGTATYYILAKAEASGFIDETDDPRADEMYVFVHGGKNVHMDENGVIHAYYSDNVVYMKDLETGERSSTPMVLIDNDSSSAEKRYLTSVVLTETDNFDVCAANLQIVVNDEYPNGIIRSAVPINSDDEVKSASKQLLDLEDYDIMSVVGRCSYVTRDESGNLLPFFDWENSGILMGFEQDLNVGYELEVCPIENPENYVCLFVVTDAQGNSTVSELIPLG